MKKFLSTVAMFALLVHVILPGAVAAQEAGTNGVDTPAVQQTEAPSVAESTDKTSDTSTSAEATQNEGEKSESFLDKVGETLSQIGDAVADIANDIKEEVKEAVETTKELISDALNPQEEEKNQTSTDESPTTGNQLSGELAVNPQASQTPEALESEEPELEIQEVQPLFFIPQFASLRGENPMEDFNNKWNNAKSCDDENVPGCVIGPKQSVGSFQNPGDVELRKLVTKTDNPGEYQIDLAVRGKEIKTTGSTENDVCAAVVFDKSGSMKDKAGKWESAVNGAKSFAETLVGKNSKAKIGLITFAREAKVVRGLATNNLDDVDFGSPYRGTNLHAGLIAAEEMFSGAASCANAKKYIVVMSDGAPTHYMQKGKVKGTGWETNGNVKKCSKETVDYANSLGDDIEIFSVGYEVEKNSNAEKVLMAIASDDKDGQAQYYPANAASVAEAFENIATTVNTAKAGTEAKLTDYLGAFVQADGVEGKEITKEIGEITEDGWGSGFTIKIDPSKGEDQATNNGVALSYKDPNGEWKTLKISQTAQVHWELPVCGGNKPDDNAQYGAEKFPQSWENGALTPASKDWTFKAQGDLEACEWTCNPEFHEENGQCVANTQPCYVDNGTGTRTWNGNGWGACENIQCDDGYHLEGESQGNDLPRAPKTSFKCVSNTKKENCIPPVPAPANGEYVVEEVEVSWNLDNNGWNPIPACSNIKCKENYKWNGQACVADEKPNQACNPLPANAQWLAGNTGTVTQVWNGSQGAWLPSLTGIYNKTGLQSNLGSCDFQCKDGFNWNGQACEVNQLTGQACTGLVENAQWLGQGVVTQVWSGTANAYLPSLIGAYNPDGSVEACDFKCKEGFKWNNGKCEKISNGGGSSGGSSGGGSSGGGSSGGGSSGGGSSGGGSSGGGSSGGGLKRDNCPNGDFSPSYYDGECGTAPDDKDEVVLSGEVNSCSIEGSPFSEEENIAYLYACQNDITTIKDINDARLNDFLTRAEMAKMITHFVTTKLNKVPNAEKDCSAFSQSIVSYSQEMQDYMTKACQLDIMGVHPDYRPLSDFMPFKNVTRAEFGTVLSRVLFGSAYEGTDEAWYQSHLNNLKKTGILTVIDPTIVEKRSWVFRMIYKSAQALNIVK